MGIHYRPREPYDAAVVAMQDDLDDEHRARALTMRALGPLPASAAGEIAAGDLAAELLWPADGSAPDLALTAFCVLLWSTAARTWAFLPGHERVTDAALRLIGLARANRDRWGEVPILETAVMASRSLDFVDHPREAYEITVAGAVEAERIGAPDLAAESHMRAAFAAVALGLPAEICTRHVVDGLSMTPTGQPQSGAWLAATIGWLVAYSSGDIEGHRARLERYTAAAELAGGQIATMMQAAIADLYVTDGRPEEAITRCREILPRRDEAAGSFIAVVVRGVLIRALVTVGDLDEAARLAALSEAALTEGTFTLGVQIDRLSVAALELVRDRPGDALDLLVDAVRLSIEREYVGAIAGLGTHVARALSALGRHQDAARTPPGRWAWSIANWCREVRRCGPRGEPSSTPRRRRAGKLSATPGSVRPSRRDGAGRGRTGRRGWSEDGQGTTSTGRWMAGRRSRRRRSRWLGTRLPG